MTGRYSHRPSSPNDEAFEDLCIQLLRDLLGEIRHKTQTKWQQIEIGDTLEGDECKLLNKWTNTGVLHIEFAEKTDHTQVEWIPSGIMCNRKRYICGNFQELFGFLPEVLRRWHKETCPEEIDGWATYAQRDAGEGATIRSFRLPRRDATRLGLFRFYCDRGSWCLEHYESVRQTTFHFWGQPPAVGIWEGLPQGWRRDGFIKRVIAPDGTIVPLADHPLIGTEREREAYRYLRNRDWHVDPDGDPFLSLRDDGLRLKQ